MMKKPDPPWTSTTIWVVSLDNVLSAKKNLTLTSRFRESVMREIMVQWPGTLSLPIMLTGSNSLYTVT